MLKLPRQLFWGAPALAGGAKTRRAAPLQRARAEPLETGRVGGHIRRGIVTRQGEDAPPSADGFGRSRLKPAPKEHAQNC
jgi:hypothetical protein